MMIISSDRAEERRITRKIFKFILIEWQGVCAEFFATMLLVFFGCMSCIPIYQFSPNPALYAPLGFGMTAMINTQIFGHISGALMNPFITVIAVIWGRISTAVGLLYILAEFAGAILGYGFLMMVSPVDIAGDAICVALPHRGLNDFQTMAIEMVLCLALSLVNCSVWDPVNAHNSDSAPIKFGLTIVGVSVAGGPLTSAGMNPARVLAPALWSNKWDSHWPYWIGPMIGVILPAVFYKYTWLKNKDLKLST